MFHRRGLHARPVKKSHRILAATGLSAVALLGGFAAAHYASATPPPALGLWAGSSISASQLGVTQDVLTDFATPGGSTGTFTSYSVPSTSLQIMLAVGDLTASEASTIGNALVAKGHANTIFRVMVEQNQCEWNTSWNESVFPGGSGYATAFRNVVTELRAVPGNVFTFVWNPNAGEGNNCNGETTQDTWPGAAYVNYVGVDVYDFGGYQANTQQIVDFATGHPDAGWPQLATPIPLAFPEWGLNGSDDTTFMDYMIGVIESPANGVAVQSYFSCPVSECPSPESDLTQFPKSRAIYAADFSSQGGPPPTTTLAPTTTRPPTTTTTRGTSSTTTSSSSPPTTRPPTTTTTHPAQCRPIKPSRHR